MPVCAYLDPGCTENAISYPETGYFYVMTPSLLISSPDALEYTK